MELNQFADWTEDEFKAILGYKPSGKTARDEVIRDANDLPESINWVEQGQVSDVKNQGACGSCWAFSATGAIESAYSIKNKEMVNFSEQQMVDCSIETGNMGCGGGLMDYAFDYAKAHPLLD